MSKCLSQNIFALLICWPLLCSAVDETTCFFQAQEYGAGANLSYIDQACLDLARASADVRSVFLDETKSLKIIGYHNMIMVVDEKIYSDISMLIAAGPRIRYIAGTETRLNHIESISYDKVKEQITVKDQDSNETLVFDAKAFGNIAPLRFH